jgi:hypothetical protein
VEPRLTAELLKTVLAWLEERIHFWDPTVRGIFADWLKAFKLLQQIYHIEQNTRRHKDKSKGKKQL